jgi:hypothetical protein
VTVGEQITSEDDPTRTIEWTLAAGTGVVEARFLDARARVVKDEVLEETGVRPPPNAGSR